MPRKKRVQKSKKRQGLESIDKLEFAHWTTYGPEIDGGRYLDWDDWFTHYETLRDELLDRIGDREKQPACEIIYQAMLAGECPETARREVLEDLKRNDPRSILSAGGKMKWKK